MLLRSCAPPLSALAAVSHHATLPALAAAGAQRRPLSSAVPSTSSSSAPASSSDGPIGIVMLNMGGPGSLDGAVDGVEPFLNRLFSDKEIIMLGPLQKWLVRSREEGVTTSEK
jgi:hypothetical protein